jgi:hypothetical protein
MFPLPPVRGEEFYRSAIDVLQSASIDFLVGGAFAFGVHTGIERDTKDFDIMLRPSDVEKTLNALNAAGYRADYAFSHWLAKAHHGEYFIDIIYRAGNGLGEVDDLWFANARRGQVFQRELLVAPPEEMIWQKSYIQERERFDGADVIHLFRSCAADIDWERLIMRFGPDWRVLLSHLVVFGFVYPAERDAVPADVMRRLTGLLHEEMSTAPGNGQLCQGTLLSRAQYLTDVERWGYADARLADRVKITAEELQDWTNAIDHMQRAH